MLTKEIFELIFPSGLFEWFDLVEGKVSEGSACLTLEEKDLPPLTEAHAGKKILNRKFHDTTITDFPLRGRRTLLTVRRRYWQVEGEKKYLTRDIEITFPGTELATEFANFLKDISQRHPDVLSQYRRYLPPGSEGI